MRVGIGQTQTVSTTPLPVGSTSTTPTLGGACTPSYPPNSVYWLGAGILGLLFLPGWWKVIPGLIAAAGAYGMWCTEPTGTWVNDSGASLTSGQVQGTCVWDTKPACALSL